MHRKLLSSWRDLGVGVRFCLPRERLEKNFLIPSDAASTAGASTGASSTPEVSVAEMDDDVAPTIPSRSTSGQNGASGS